MNHDVLDQKFFEQPLSTVSIIDFIYQFYRIGKYQIGNMAKRNLKNWSNIFKGLGNVNRLKILKALLEKQEVSVSELADLVGISFKNTSRNLNILLNLGLVEYKGKEGRVFYSLSADLDNDIKWLIKLLVG
jgi:DNA-binding transcriptional ArsR family regulator